LLRLVGALASPSGQATKNPFTSLFKGKTVLVQVSASIAEEGLGLAMWWEQPADGADDMEDA